MAYTSFYTGIGTVIGFISGFVVNKVIAVFIGPSGVAMISQFQNFIAISTVAATGGIEQGAVKYVAEVRKKEENKAVVLSTSLRIDPHPIYWPVKSREFSGTVCWLRYSFGVKSPSEL
jgi:O-antigen/teichoic acid export membrane protein